MNNENLRDALIQQLWRMNKMDIISYLREFIEGELATLWYLNEKREQTAIPSIISDNLRISRARTAIILRTLREKGFVKMDISEEDRRKMTVVLTPEGKKYLDEKYSFLLDYFDKYVEVMGAEKITELTELLKFTADQEQMLALKSCKVKNTGEENQT